MATASLAHDSSPRWRDKALRESSTALRSPSRWRDKALRASSTAIRRSSSSTLLMSLGGPLVEQGMGIVAGTALSGGGATTRIGVGTTGLTSSPTRTAVGAFNVAWTVMVSRSSPGSGISRSMLMWTEAGRCSDPGVVRGRIRNEKLEIPVEYSMWTTRGYGGPEIRTGREGSPPTGGA